MYIQIDQKLGTLSVTQTAITTGTFEQQWGLDATGNWKTFNMPRHSVAGNLSGKFAFENPQDSSLSRKSRHGVSSNIVGTWELNQTRTTNKADEITGITNSVGVAWATPTEALEIWRAGDVNLLMCQFESRKIRALT